MSLYPSLAVPTISDEKLSESETTPQTFRLQKIGELETFLRSEVEFRSVLFNNYSRAVNMVNGVSASCAVFGLSARTGGLALIVTGVGVKPGLILEGLLSCPAWLILLESPSVEDFRHKRQNMKRIECWLAVNSKPYTVMS